MIKYLIIYTRVYQNYNGIAHMDQKFHNLLALYWVCEVENKNIKVTGLNSVCLKISCRISCECTSIYMYKVDKLVFDITLIHI